MKDNRIRLQISFLFRAQSRTWSRGRRLGLYGVGLRTPRGLENVWNGADSPKRSRWEAARFCRWERAWPTCAGSRCRSCSRPTSGSSSWQSPPYLASGLLEIRKSAQERRDEAGVILEDSVEWHDRHHFLLGQKWHRAIFFSFFLNLIPAVFHWLNHGSCIEGR